MILFLTPAFLAGAIAEDRQRKVLFYLLASPLSGAEIVLGKVAARLINLVVLVLVGLPVMSLCLFLGGIDPVEVWLAYGVSFASLYFLAGLSIYLSVYTPPASRCDHAGLPAGSRLVCASNHRAQHQVHRWAGWVRSFKKPARSRSGSPAAVHVLT